MPMSTWVMIMCHFLWADSPEFHDLGPIGMLENSRVCENGMFTISRVHCPMDGWFWNTMDAAVRMTSSIEIFIQACVRSLVSSHLWERQGGPGLQGRPKKLSCALNPQIYLSVVLLYVKRSGYDRGWFVRLNRETSRLDGRTCTQQPVDHVKSA